MWQAPTTTAAAGGPPPNGKQQQQPQPHPLVQCQQSCKHGMLLRTWLHAVVVGFAYIHARLLAYRGTTKQLLYPALCWDIETNIMRRTRQLFCASYSWIVLYIHVSPLRRYLLLVLQLLRFMHDTAVLALPLLHTRSSHYLQPATFTPVQFTCTSTKWNMTTTKLGTRHNILLRTNRTRSCWQYRSAEMSPCQRPCQRVCQR